MTWLWAAGPVLGVDGEVWQALAAVTVVVGALLTAAGWTVVRVRRAARRAEQIWTLLAGDPHADPPVPGIGARMDQVAADVAAVRAAVTDHQGRLDRLDPPAANGVPGGQPARVRP